jgi:tetratricopeptide (TPR) repeat protein
VAQARNRWITLVILGLCLLAFFGVSLVPLISGLSRSPSSPNTANNNGSLSPSEQKSKLEDQVRGYELVLQREPENQAALKGLIEARLRLLTQKGKSERKRADYEGVIEPLEKLAKLNPQNSQYGVLLAQAKQEIGDREGAALAYRSILKDKPGDLNALQGMVQLQISEERPEAAIGLLKDTLATAEQANKIQPNSVDVVAVQVLLGNIHASQKDYTQAQVIYDQAIKKHPQDFRPVLAKAMALKEQGKTDAAKSLFDNAATLAPAGYKDQINKLATQPLPTSTASPTPTATPSP